MIRFDLKCSNGHSFDSWFQSGTAFEKLQKSGLVTCAACGTAEVAKSIMAPAVSTTNDIAAPQPKPHPLEKLREEVEAKADYVGSKFAKQARDMHDGTTPTRAIYGEAKPDEAKKLLADGVPVMPLPFIPRKKTN